MRNSTIGTDAAGLLVAFQDTGKDFEPLWEVLSPVISQIAVNRLRKHLVFDGHNRVDQVAVEEVRQQVGLKLFRLALPEQKGRFDPQKATPGLAGVTRWLFGIVSNETADYCRTWRNGRGKVKVSSLFGLELNSLRGTKAAKTPPQKWESLDVSAILNRCINELPEELSAPLRLRLRGVTDRDAGKRLGCSASTVNKRIARAVKILRPILEAEGVDAAAIDSLAA